MAVIQWAILAVVALIIQYATVIYAKITHKFPTRRYFLLSLIPLSIYILFICRILTDISEN